MFNCFTNGQIKDKKSLPSLTYLLGFHPLDEKLYTLTDLDQEVITKFNMSYQKVSFNYTLNPLLSYKWLDINSYYIKKRHNSQEKLSLIHLKNKSISTVCSLTIIFSHSSTVTVGKDLPFIIDLSYSLKCDVISYDYSGYGYSQGDPNEKEIYSDIGEVFYFTTFILEIPIHNIIVMGQALGTVPTVHIASQKASFDICGMILLSPIALAYSIDKKTKQAKEIFCNKKKIGKVTCPVFIIHGCKDTSIPIAHSYELAKHASISCLWYPKYGKHNNIVTKKKYKFYQKLLNFKKDLLCVNNNKYFKHVSHSDKNLLNKINNLGINDNCDKSYLMNNKSQFSLKNLDNYDFNNSSDTNNNISSFY